MTMLRDLPPGTRCLVDVAAMERDGPEMLACRCDRTAVWREVVRALAEQIVTVREGALYALCISCRVLQPASPEFPAITAYIPKRSSPEQGFKIRRKYLLPLPEQGGETDGR